MTLVGKTICFFVLIFSLAQGALVLFLYTARTQWSTQYVELEKRFKVSEANVTQMAVERDNAYRERDDKLAQSENEKKQMRDENTQQKTRIATLESLQKEWGTNNDKAKTSIEKAQAEVQRMQDDIDHLRKTLNDQLAENKKLSDQAIVLRNEKITAEIELRTTQDKYTQLSGKLEELAKDLARLKAGPGGATTARGTGPNPPAENIEGLIRKTDPSGLVSITLGSDAGLKKDHTLEVYRLSNVPDQSKYLGRIRIIDVSATEAVGQPMGRMSVPLQVGDRVASRILGN
jgi:hypothetical protein